MNFREALYISPEYQEEPLEEPSLEEREAVEKIAAAKLERLSGQELRRVAVRFMNIEEYRLLLEATKKEEGYYGEVVMHDLSTFLRSNITARDALPWLARDPAKDVNWDGLDASFKQIDLIIKEAKEVENEHKGESRKEKLGLIREKILDQLWSPRTELWQLRKVPHTPEQILDEATLTDSQAVALQELKTKVYENRYSRRFVDEVQASLNLDPGLVERFWEACYNERMFGAENLRIISEFVNNPEYIQQPGALKEVANAFAYAIDKGYTNTKDKFYTRDNRQYQVMVVFDTDALNIAYDGNNRLSWGNLKTGNIKKGTFGEGVLAAVSLIRLREFEEELIRLQYAFGDGAHPILEIMEHERTKRVVTRWPKVPSDSARV